MMLGTQAQAMLMCTPEAAQNGLQAGHGGSEDSDICGMPAPVVDVPKELCQVFTKDDSTFVRGVDGDDPLPSSRLYVFHSMTRDSANRDPHLMKLFNEIQPLPYVVNYSMPLWSSRGKAHRSERVSAFNVETNGRGSPMGTGPIRPESTATGPEVEDEPGAGMCEKEFVDWDSIVIQLFVGGPGSGAPMHYHQDGESALFVSLSIASWEIYTYFYCQVFTISETKRKTTNEMLSYEPYAYGNLCHILHCSHQHTATWHQALVLAATFAQRRYWSR